MNSVRGTPEEKRKARRKVLWSLLASILFHLFLILLIAWLFQRSHGEKSPVFAKKQSAELVLNFLPASAPQYLETTSRQASEKSPKQAYFESDKNTQAASELSSTGKVPLPTLDGEVAEGLQFENREYSPGKHSGGGMPTQASATKPEVQEQQKQASKEPAPTHGLPILKPQNEPSHSSKETESQQTPKWQMHSLSAPALPAEQPGYQSETRVVRIDGNISNRGRVAADVAATPLGRYKTLLSNAIGARWYYLVQRDLDMYRIGTVAIRFSVLQNGKIEAVKVISNTSNEILAATSIQSITNAEMPPIPPDLASSLHGAKIEVDYSFSIISN